MPSNCFSPDKYQSIDVFALGQVGRISPADTIRRLLDLNKPGSAEEEAFLVLAEAIEVLVEADDQSSKACLMEAK